MKTLHLRRRRAGATLVETMMGVAITTVTLAGMASGSMYLVKGMNNSLVDAPLTSSGRAGVDEILYQLRGGTQIVSSYTFSGGTTVTTGSNAIVFKAPAYTPSGSSVILRDSSGNAKWDYIGFALNGNKQLLEYVDTATGSYRASRTTAFVVAKNVNNLATGNPIFTRYAGHTVQLSQSTSTGGTVTFSNVTYAPVSGSLAATYTINGSTAYGASTPVYSATGGVGGTPQITVSNIPSGSGTTVYVTYSTASSVVSSTTSTGLANASLINVELDLTDKDSRNVDRTVVTEGSAFLHNYGRSL